MIEQLSRLQAKIWALQSENDLLNAKMVQMVQTAEYKDHYIKTINSQLQIILQDLLPKPANFKKGPSSISGLQFKSPASAKEDLSNHNSAPQHDGLTRAELHGLPPRLRGKFNS